MTPSSAIWVGVRKEARALWLPWATCAATLVAVAVLESDRRIPLRAELVYFMGSVALAALAIGHEYTHGTLSLMLSLPSDRRRLLLVKLGVLTPMLATLGLVALAVLSARPGFGPSPFSRASMLCALLMAPWLTMLCRSPLGGAVFAIGVTGQIHLFADVVGIARFGWADTIASKQQFTLAVLWWSLLGAGAVAAVAGWRTFMRLEAIDGRGPEVRWPRWLVGEATPTSAALPSRRGRPLWLLAQKELRLQQLSFIVAGLHVLGWVALSTFYRGVPEAADALAVVGAIYGGSLALLIGSLASAEERQLGTLEWHAMLPVAAWKQWAVKVGIVLVLALLLSFALPVLLAAPDVSVSPWHAGIVLFLATVSLYVSSLCTNVTQSLVLSVAVTFAVLLLVGWSWGAQMFSVSATALVTVGAFVALTLRLAFNNHQRARMDRTQVRRQLAWLAAVATAATIAARY